MAAIKFKINWQKAIEAIVWLARGRPGISPFFIAKVLYYADKKHLQLYARPILGDTYIKMEHGPVPSGVQDLVNMNSFLDPDLLEAAAAAIKVSRGNVPKVKARRKPNLDVFSPTDIACLEGALAEYGDLPFAKLRELSHSERAWREAPENGPMDYSLMLDDDLPDRDELLEEIEENAAYAVL
ncbi:MAG: SocA family protein [Proteobacteria bacterium]|nr:SocA family protein [Pseudomonadota bacterium]